MAELRTDSGERFQQLVEIMRTLRSDHGCAWDRQQTVKTLRPFVLEETYELLEALDRGDYDSLKHELGDFLFEAVFLAQICEEEGRFSIADSITSISEKLIRRHPHVFDADGLPSVAPAKAGKASLTPKEVKQQWEEIKSAERTTARNTAGTAAGEPEQTILSGVPRAMPSLLRAYELSTRAAQVGFEWAATEDVIDKVEEEVRELREAVAQGGGKSAEAEEEFGDLLFSLVNVARQLGIEPEAALRIANDKFQRRFDDVERQVTAGGHRFRDLTLEQLEERWVKAKATTKDT
jgi:MazG family protein